MTRQKPTTTPSQLLALAVAACSATWAPPLMAEKADRSKPMVVEADKPGTLDLQRQVVVFNGNVSITQGSMLIRADQVELREMPDGYRYATAVGGAGKQATFKQKRDNLDETIEGLADKIEFDGRADTVRFVGKGNVRRLRGTAVADDITGALIVWDNTSELFSVTGGAATPGNPGGRVRAVLSPRADVANAAASGAAAKPAVPASGAIKPSRALGG